MRGAEVSPRDFFFFFLTFSKTSIGKSCQPCWKQKIRCMLRGPGPLSSKRVQTEEAQTPRPHKKQRTELEAVIQAPKKPEMYLKVKWNYSFRIHMASLIETLVSEMVRQREAEERTAAALERLMKWVEESESELESDREELEKLLRNKRESEKTENPTVASRQKVRVAIVAM